jgi:hypothetical protein
MQFTVSLVILVEKIKVSMVKTKVSPWKSNPGFRAILLKSSFQVPTSLSL